MRDLRNGSVKEDSEVYCYDGIVTIIYVKKIGEDGMPEEHGCDVLYINAEYDEPLSLADIVKKYPGVEKVIFDDALEGYVYNYNNHQDGWECVGEVLGYA